MPSREPREKKTLSVDEREREGGRGERNESRTLISESVQLGDGGRRESLSRVRQIKNTHFFLPA